MSSDTLQAVTPWIFAAIGFGLWIWADFRGDAANVRKARREIKRLKEQSRVEGIRIFELEAELRSTKLSRDHWHQVAFQDATDDVPEQRGGTMAKRTVITDRYGNRQPTRFGLSETK